MSAAWPNIWFQPVILLDFMQTNAGQKHTSWSRAPRSSLTRSLLLMSSCLWSMALNCLSRGGSRCSRQLRAPCDEGTRLHQIGIKIHDLVSRTLCTLQPLVPLLLVLPSPRYKLLQIMCIYIYINIYIYVYMYVYVYVCVCVCVCVCMYTHVCMYMYI